MAKSFRAISLFYQPNIDARALCLLRNGLGLTLRQSDRGRYVYDGAAFALYLIKKIACRRMPVESWRFAHKSNEASPQTQIETISMR